MATYRHSQPQQTLFTVSPGGANVHRDSPKLYLGSFSRFVGLRLAIVSNKHTHTLGQTTERQYIGNNRPHLAHRRRKG